jgi:hypothetical protein
VPAISERVTGRAAKLDHPALTSVERKSGHRNVQASGCGSIGEPACSRLRVAALEWAQEEVEAR